MRVRLEQVESGGAGGADVGDAAEEIADLQARLEMALGDLRELKGRNGELEMRLKSAPAAGESDATTAGAMGWEAQKERLLAQLDEDFDQGDPIQQRERLTIEKAMQTTQRAVEEKEAEINRLQALLEQQATAVDATMAVGAQGIAGILESDELIREERENLIRLQDECREKMRTAEVELAVERAKIAPNGPRWTRNCGISRPR